MEEELEPVSESWFEYLLSPWFVRLYANLGINGIPLRDESR